MTLWKRFVDAVRPCRRMLWRSSQHGGPTLNNRFLGARAFAHRGALGLAVLSSAVAGSAALSAESGRAEALRPAPKPEANWPLTAADIKARAPKTDRVSTKAAQAWAAEDRIVAEARCAVLLKGLKADYSKVEPFKEGDCGSPAPLEVRSIGTSPAVVLSPPAIVSCDMLAAMHTWLRRDLQPLARSLIGSPVIKIEVMSSYSCRNAYGRAKTRLSEHGRANALDIRGFVTAGGKDAALLADWGPTRREILMAASTEAAAARKAAKAPTPQVASPTAVVGTVPMAAGAAVAETQPGTSAGGDSASAAGSFAAAVGASRAAADMATGSLRSTIGTVGRAVGLVTPPAAQEEREEPEGTGPGRLLSFSPPSRLGGPKRKKAQPAPLPPNGEQLFLRKGHEAACEIFGTVLGPEANNAHRNHFHVDMAERRSGSYCK